MANVQNILVLT